MLCRARKAKCWVKTNFNSPCDESWSPLGKKIKTKLIRIETGNQLPSKDSKYRGKKSWAVPAPKRSLRLQCDICVISLIIPLCYKLFAQLQNSHYYEVLLRTVEWWMQEEPFLPLWRDSEVSCVGFNLMNLDMPFMLGFGSMVGFVSLMELQLLELYQGVPGTFP